MAFDQIELLENPYHAQDLRETLSGPVWREEDVMIICLVALLYYDNERR